MYTGDGVKRQEANPGLPWSVLSLLSSWICLQLEEHRDMQMKEVSVCFGEVVMLVISFPAERFHNRTSLSYCWFASTWQGGHVGGQCNNFFSSVTCKWRLVLSGEKCFCSCSPIWPPWLHVQISNRSKWRYEIYAWRMTSKWAVGSPKCPNFCARYRVYFSLYF